MSHCIPSSYHIMLYTEHITPVNACNYAHSKRKFGCNSRRWWIHRWDILWLEQRKKIRNRHDKKQYCQLISIFIFMRLFSEKIALWMDEEYGHLMIWNNNSNRKTTTTNNTTRENFVCAKMVGWVEPEPVFAIDHRFCCAYNMKASHTCLLNYVIFWPWQNRNMHV